MSYFTNSFDDKVVELLKSGAVGFMPADTIYGLSCEAKNEAAVKRLHEIKNRDKKPFIILISKINQLQDDLGLNIADFEPAFRYWPGKLTAIGKAEKAPEYLHMGMKTLAVRRPDSNELCRLIDEVGPIVSTSANLSGQKPATDVKEAMNIFGDQLDFYVDAGERDGQPSTIVRLNFGKLEIIRQGEVKINDT